MCWRIASPVCGYSGTKRGAVKENTADRRRGAAGASSECREVCPPVVIRTRTAARLPAFPGTGGAFSFLRSGAFGSSACAAVCFPVFSEGRRPAPCGRETARTALAPVAYRADGWCSVWWFWTGERLLLQGVRPSFFTMRRVRRALFRMAVLDRPPTALP